MRLEKPRKTRIALAHCKRRNSGSPPKSALPVCHACPIALVIMESYPQMALKKVEAMTASAASEPAKAVSFQGAPGANSHLAALQYDPACLPLPCFSFEDAIDAVEEGWARARNHTH